MISVLYTEYLTNDFKKPVFPTIYRQQEDTDRLMPLPRAIVQREICFRPGFDL